MHAIENNPFQHGMPVQVRLQKNLFDALEGWRRKQETIPSRPEAVRRLLQQALHTCADLEAAAAQIPAAEITRPGAGVIAVHAIANNPAKGS